MRIPFPTLALTILAAAAAIPAAAQAPAPNLEAGRARATTVCAACHGANGVSVADAIPNLAGQKQAYLEAQLRALKSGARKNAVMNAIAAQLAPEDIANVAAFFASLPGAGVASVVVVATLTLPGPRPGPFPSILASIREGFAYAFAEPGLRTVVVYMTVNSLLAAPFIALVSPMALQVLDAGGAGVSVLVTAQGIGAVTMAVSLGGLVRRYTQRRVLAAVLWLLPVALVAYAWAPTLWTSAACIFVVGALYIGALSSFTSSAQTRSPAEIRGRVMSVLNVLLGLLYPIGSIVQGRLADSIGQRVVTAGAAMTMLGVLAVLSVARPGLFRRLETPAARVEISAATAAT